MVRKPRAVMAMLQQFHDMGSDLVIARLNWLPQPGPVTILTSDLDDMRALCGDRAYLIGL